MWEQVSFVVIMRFVVNGVVMFSGLGRISIGFEEMSAKNAGQFTSYYCMLSQQRGSFRCFSKMMTFVTTKGKHENSKRC